VLAIADYALKLRRLRRLAASQYVRLTRIENYPAAGCPTGV
jgi:hypothetical protein